ncbi:hypothetical protein JW905_09395 [bacterium]|nr:hypothetical protein [candidate division CSSED10-310 bacterium]
MYNGTYENGTESMTNSRQSDLAGSCTMQSTWPVTAFLGLLAHRIIILVHAGTMEQNFAAAFGVIAGHPHWRVYQSRLLGPWLVRMFETVLDISFQEAFVLVAMVLTVGIGLLALVLACRAGVPRPRALGLTAALLGVVVALQDPLYLYLWDYLDILVFLLVAHGIVNRRGVWWFVCLFLIALANKESALFIALWLFLDGLTDAGPGSLRLRWYPARWPRALAGLVLSLGGILTMEVIRDRLFVAGTGRVAAAAGSTLGTSLHFKLWRNATSYWMSLRHPDGMLTFLVPLAVPAFTAFCVIRYRRRLDDAGAKLLWLVLIMLVCIHLFASVIETRSFLMLTPLLFTVCAVYGGPPPGAKLSQ